MLALADNSFDDEHELIGQQYNDRLRVIARQSVTVWFNRDRLDTLLASYIGVLDDCELLYAIDVDGRQISSNIHQKSIDVSAHGQDLSQRPYSISLKVLKDPLDHGAFACRSYISKTTQNPCVTVLYPVSTGATLLGYIAADVVLPDD